MDVPAPRRDRALAAGEWGAAVLLTGMAVWVHAARLQHAGGLWRDEAGALGVATQPTLGEVFRQFPHEAFPLAVPLALRAWVRVLGDGDLALRCFGMAVGLALVAALWLAARLAGRALPLLSLALVAANAAVVVFGDAVRGYGLGSIFILASFAALARLLVRPGRGAAAVALLALLGAVHCLLANAALVAALCVAAALAALRLGNRRLAGLVLGLGLAAGLSLLPYAAPLAAARAWDVVVLYPTDAGQIARVLAATLGPGSAPWAWLALTVLALAATAWLAVRPAASRHAAGAGGRGAGNPGGAGAAIDAVATVRLFSGLTIVLAVAAQVLFLDVLSYTPRAWYDLPLITLAAAALEVIFAGLCRTPVARAGRIGLALALAAALLPAALPRLRFRMTDADLVARRVEEMASAGDLVVVSPWYYGVSFSRYYHGPVRWITLPDLPDHRIHRYDLLKEHLASAQPIADVLREVARTLEAGRRVWVVGRLRLPRPGQAPPLLPPAPATAWGWQDLPYQESWTLQLGACLAGDCGQAGGQAGSQAGSRGGPEGAQGAQDTQGTPSGRVPAAALEVVPISSPDPISPLETIALTVARPAVALHAQAPADSGRVH